MPNDNILLDPGTGGEKLRTRTSTIDTFEVHEQSIYMPGADTFYAYADNVSFANNKHHIGIFNASSSGKVISLRKLFAINLHTATATGIVQRFNINKITSMSGGTSITPVKSNTLNDNLPAQITVAAGPTVGGASIMFPWMSLSEENPTTNAVSQAVYQQATNILMEGGPIQEFTLREGEGMSVAQAINSTVGTFGWILVFTVI